MLDRTFDVSNSLHLRTRCYIICSIIKESCKHDFVGRASAEYLAPSSRCKTAFRTAR